MNYREYSWIKSWLSWDILIIQGSYIRFYDLLGQGQGWDVDIF